MSRHAPPSHKGPEAVAGLRQRIQGDNFEVVGQLVSQASVEAELREKLLSDEASEAVWNRKQSIPMGEHRHADVEIRADLEAALNSQNFGPREAAKTPVSLGSSTPNEAAEDSRIGSQNACGFCVAEGIQRQECPICGEAKD